MHVASRLFTSAVFVAALAASSAWGQQAQTVRLRGTIEWVDGPTLIVKTDEAGDVTVKLPDTVAVFGIVQATLADVKPGAFIGVGAMPQPDGSQKAIQVMIFSESQRHGRGSPAVGSTRCHHDECHRRYHGHER